MSILSHLLPAPPELRAQLAAANARADRAEAALAAQVTVKPLEWRTAKISDKWERWIADTIFGQYEILEYSNGSFGWNICFYDEDLEALQYATKNIEAAKAAAQADYEARIRSALTVTPHDPAKVQALVEAGERMTGPLWRLILADEHCLKSPCDMPTCECRQKFDRIAGPWTAALAAMKEG